jgi:hypothetical protein
MKVQITCGDPTTHSPTPLTSEIQRDGTPAVLIGPPTNRVASRIASFKACIHARETGPGRELFPAEMKKHTVQSVR